jgi:hypothetical protein
MYRLMTFIIILASVIIISSCDRGGVKPVEMGEFETYVDDFTKFEVQYPGNWYTIENKGEFFWAFSDSLARRRFKAYDAEGFPGARLAVFAKKIDSVNTYEKIIDDFTTKKWKQEVITEKEVTKLAGKEAHKIVYEFQRLDGLFKGITLVTTVDSITATVFSFESFASTFDEMYKPKVDEIMNNLKLAQTIVTVPDTLYEEVEADPPSSTLKSVSGTGFSLQIPDNFGKERDQWKSASSLESYLYLGQRRGDSQIKVEIFEAENASLKSIVDDNKGAFGNATPQQTTLSGQEAFVMSYAPGNELKGKVWFVKNNDKLYRVLITWYTPEEADYKPVFEKVVNTFTFK